jgi:membrane-associated phospholipid phosphatase
MQGMEPRIQSQITENSRVIWSIIALAAIADLYAYHVSGLGIDFGGSFNAFFVIPVIAAVSYYYSRWRPDPWIATGVESCAQITSILLLGMMLSYPLATTAFPYRDHELNALDVAMGFDWQSYLDFFNARPKLALLSKVAYCSMQLQYPFAILALTMSSRFLRLQQYIFAIVVALAITLVIFAFVPAVGAYAYLRISADHYVNLDPIMTFEQMHHVEAMRNKSWSVIRDMEGLISFPSFHTISAILFTWVLFPIRRLRWWILSLNVALIVSTPVQGAHYFIDILAGGLVAIIAIFSAPLLARDYKLSELKSRSAEQQDVRALIG